MISAADDIAPVLARDVNWDALLASRLVSEADVRLVKSYDKKDADARNAILTEVRAATTPDATSRPPTATAPPRAPRPPYQDLARDDHIFLGHRATFDLYPPPLPSRALIASHPSAPSPAVRP